MRHGKMACAEWFNCSYLWFFTRFYWMHINLFKVNAHINKAELLTISQNKDILQKSTRVLWLLFMKRFMPGSRLRLCIHSVPTLCWKCTPQCKPLTEGSDVYHCNGICGICRPKGLIVNKKKHFFAFLYNWERYADIRTHFWLPSGK